MSAFLLGTAVFILATVALGLARILKGPADADRMMAAHATPFPRSTVSSPMDCCLPWRGSGCGASTSH